MTPGDTEENFKQLQEYVLGRLDKMLTLNEEPNTSAVVDEAAAGIHNIITQLSAIAATVPVSRIGFFGRRGAGKTTLINRIIDCDLLPTGGGRPITASITEINGWQEKNYTAMITFITKSEWEETVRAAQYEWDENHKEVSNKHVNKDNFDADNLCQQMKAVWGDGFDARFPDKSDTYRFKDIDSSELLPQNCLELLQKQYMILSFPDCESLKSELDNYTEREKQFWPLVSYITVYGPFQRLKEGSFSLVDIPGEGDEHELVLNRRFEEGRAVCDRLFYLPEKDQLISAHTAKVCISAENHLCSQFALIVSHLKAHLKNFKEKKWDVTNVEQNIQLGLNNNLHDPVEKSILNRVPIFCIENKKNVDENCFREKFDHMMQLAFSRKSQDDIEACQSRFIDHANNVFAFLTLLLGLESEKVDALKAAMQNIMKEYPRVKCSKPVDEWFATLPQDIKGDLLTRMPECHYTHLQKALSGQNDIVMNRILYIVISRKLGGDIEAFDRLRNHLTKDLIQVRDTVYTSFTDCLKEHNVEPQQFLKTYLWKPHFDQFNTLCLEEIVKQLRSIYSQSWKSFRESGLGCQKRMFSSLAQWEIQNTDNIKNTVYKAILTSCQQQVDQLIEQFVNQCDFLLQKLTELPQLHETLKKLKQLDLLKPIDHNDLLENLLSSNVEANNSIVDASTLIENKTKKLQLAERKLEEIIIANSAILCPVSLFRMQLRKIMGTVYVLKNNAFQDNIYKIGRTDVKLESRMKQLYTTGVPLAFEKEQNWSTSQSRTFESLMHSIFMRVRVNRRREFFNAPLPLIKEVGNRVKDVVDLL
ncbi:unnamed protein product [Adineta steineri]|uniref:Bacteriophage T5 Orf172 DNA-binding domain-containing protein n=1 Tax=Adineta steineri TaxID=433720 RepID=A0A815FDX5_9BILA|nr:unnamed protein product [Adineta steineri]CAF1372148.1 unnamed protein product [Adineta steineri]CAF4030266.1 unnamed protein product [Adineta steineri]CAF4040753.1 unnamed protein product [Adineta steineri]